MSINFNVIIAGSKDFNNYQMVKALANQVLGKRNGIEVISNFERGASSLGITYARERKVSVKRIAPDWDKDGKKAARKNNIKMVNEADALVAFWNTEDKNTKHLIQKAQNVKIPVRVFDMNGNYIIVKSEKDEVTEAMYKVVDNFKAEDIAKVAKLKLMSRPAINQGVGAREFSRATGKYYIEETGSIVNFECGYDMDDTKYAKLTYIFEEDFMSNIKVEIEDEEVVDGMVRTLEYMYSYEDDVEEDNELNADFLDEAVETAWEEKTYWDKETNSYEGSFEKLVNSSWNGRLRSYRDDEPNYYKPFTSSQLPELKLAQKNYFHSFDKKYPIRGLEPTASMA